MPPPHLAALEEKIPWTAVKKTWATRRNEWVTTVSNTQSCAAIARELLTLESMLKSETLASNWQVQKAVWRGRCAAVRSLTELKGVTGELDQAIQWQRILVAPDGRPLTEAEIASGQFGIGGLPPVPLPPPLSVAAPPNPPEGVPRAASRILLLLQSMGAKQFDPKVVTQLLDVMQTWTCTVLLDASQNARMRLLSRQTYQQQQQQQAAPSGEPMVEVADVELATRLRMESGQFTRTAPREVLAQQAADANAEPMPILPRRSVVVPPTDAAQVAPAARRLLAAGLEIDDDDELEEHYRDQPALTPSGAVVRGGAAAADGALLPERDEHHSWWHDRVQRASMPRIVADPFAAGAGGGAAGSHKRQKVAH